MAKTLQVSGSVVLGQALNLSTAENPTLSVGGPTTLGDSLNISGITTLLNHLSVGETFTLKNTLSVSGITRITSALSVGGASNFKSSLSVNGNIYGTFFGGLYVENFFLYLFIVTFPDSQLNV